MLIPLLQSLFIDLPINPVLPRSCLCSEKNCGLRLVATRDFVTADGQAKKAGDEWLFEGPGTYIPRIEVKVAEELKAQVIKPNEALKLRARVDFEKAGVRRTVGEEWLVTAVGAYLPSVHEEVVGKVKARVLTDKVALHLEATKFGVAFVFWSALFPTPFGRG